MWHLLSARSVSLQVRLELLSIPLATACDPCMDESRAQMFSSSEVHHAEAMHGCSSSSTFATSSATTRADGGAGLDGLDRPADAYSVPSLPPALQLHCAFVSNRSLLFRTMIQLLGPLASAVESPLEVTERPQRSGGADGNCTGEPTTKSLSEVACAYQVSPLRACVLTRPVLTPRALDLQAAASILRLVWVVLRAEPAVRSKLKRVRDSQTTQW